MMCRRRPPWIIYNVRDGSVAGDYVILNLHLYVLVRSSVDFIKSFACISNITYANSIAPGSYRWLTVKSALCRYYKNTTMWAEMWKWWYKI